MRQYIPVLSIAGSDSSGGAGIQADIKTISATGCYAMTAITAITAQNTTGVRSIQSISPDIVADQIDAVWEDIPPMAVKTGMLYSAEIINIVADRLEKYAAGNVVVDPVMVASSGSELSTADFRDAVISRLVPQSSIITPNRDEAIALTGRNDIEGQIKAFREMGARAILLKGGDKADASFSTDILSLPGEEPIELRADRIKTPNTHGTGCTLSSAIASFLALGFPMTDAVKAGKSFITRAIVSGANYEAGHGHGPVNHLFAPRKTKFIIE